MLVSMISAIGFVSEGVRSLVVGEAVIENSGQRSALQPIQEGGGMNEACVGECMFCHGGPMLGGAGGGQ